MAKAAAQFDVFVTADQNIQFQQNLRTLPISVLVLCAADNRLASLRPLLPALLQRLVSLNPNTLQRIHA